MTEISALEKHACPACGAQAEWNPTKQKLECPFCGTESPYEVDRETGKVVELDLVKALRELPEDERGWLTARRSVQCQSCHAVMVFDPDRVGQNCEFCGSPAIVSYDEIKAPIRPQGVLPFKIDSSRVRDDIRRWWRSKWLAPARLARTALVDTVRSLYIPYWTFDAQVVCPWQADAGHYYYVNVPGVDRQGRPVMRRERRTRWEPASGSIDHSFDDEPVPGTQGLPLDLLRQVEPFPTQEVVGYDTAFLSGHVVEHYKIVLLDAAQQSVPANAGQARAALRGAGPRRHIPQPAHSACLLWTDVQTRPRPCLAAVVRLWREGVPGDRQRVHRSNCGQVSEKYLEDLAARPAGRHRGGDSDLAQRGSMTWPAAGLKPPRYALGSMPLALNIGLALGAERNSIKALPAAAFLAFAPVPAANDT